MAGIGRGTGVVFGTFGTLVSPSRTAHRAGARAAPPPLALGLGVSFAPGNVGERSHAVRAPSPTFIHLM
ncbi:hypothetical protein GCM10017778_49750 [Streptomyces vinaceus]|nr:hypothetical protein GCM10017778_49750 [Streptomyces vinaceus]